MKNSKILMYAVICLAIFLLKQFYVNAATFDVGNTCIYTSIQDAIDDANSGDEIVVQDGTYYENINFLGKAINVVSLNGPNVTTIAGQINDSIVIFENGEGDDSILDGFTITNGYASYGGGIKCRNDSSPTIQNCVITGNHATDSGGGIICRNNCSPDIISCTITENSAGSNGGGIYCEHTTLALRKNVIAGNEASSGGGIYAQNSFVQLVNCTISGNYADYAGGGINLFDSNSRVIHCTISSNHALYYGGGFSCYESNLKVLNSILWGNQGWDFSDGAIYNGSNSFVRLSWSDFESASISTDMSSTFQAGFGNINSDPCFVDFRPPTQAPTSAGDYHLDSGSSPCVDAGTGASRTLPGEDIDGNSRPQSGTGYGPAKFDMGSDEYVAEVIWVPNPNLRNLGQDRR